MNKEIKDYIDEKVEQFRSELIKSMDEKEKTVWDLRFGDEYYSLSACGEIKHFNFDGCEYDIDFRDIGNMFLTREEAEFELERRKMEAIMKKYSRPFKNIGSKYYIYYSHTCSEILITTTYIDAGYYYFDSKEAAQQVINEVGKGRLLKYWFKVEE